MRGFAFLTQTYLHCLTLLRLLCMVALYNFKGHLSQAPWPNYSSQSQLPVERTPPSIREERKIQSCHLCLYQISHYKTMLQAIKNIPVILLHIPWDFAGRYSHNTSLAEAHLIKWHWARKFKGNYTYTCFSNVKMGDFIRVQMHIYLKLWLWKIVSQNIIDESMHHYLL